jgi:hypothetical protein
LRTAELNDEPAMRKLVSGSPEATAMYDEYLASKAAQTKVSKQIDKELEIRRSGLTKIVNDERENVFPGEVVPETKVVRKAEDTMGNASYLKGQIRIKDADLISADTLHRGLMGDNLTGSLLHETKHAEQDALRIRSLIDDITGGDTSGRTLTKSELEAVATKMYGATDANAEALISDVNRQRAGRPLTELELERANGLEESRAKRKYAAHQFEEDRLGKLSASYAEMFTPEHSGLKIPSQYHLNDSDFYTTFSNPSPELKALKHEYDNMPTDETGIPKFDEDFEKRSAPIVERDLSEEIERSTSKVKDNYQEYRNWLHEREAWAISEAVKKAVPPTMDPERLLRRLLSDDW